MCDTSYGQVAGFLKKPTALSRKTPVGKGPTGVGGLARAESKWVRFYMRHMPKHHGPRPAPPFPSLTPTWNLDATAVDCRAGVAALGVVRFFFGEVS